FQSTTNTMRPTLAISFLTFFFFLDPPTTQLSTLSLHDALPISAAGARHPADSRCATGDGRGQHRQRAEARSARSLRRQGRRRSRDRKSTRLNSSHSQISYAVFCLKKKKKQKQYKNSKNTL